MLGFMAILVIVTIIVVTHVPEKLRRLSFWVIQEEGCPILVLQKLNGEFQNIGSAIDFKHFGLNLNNTFFTFLPVVSVKRLSNTFSFFSLFR